MSAVLTPLAARSRPLADFTAPKIEYGDLAPLLVVFGAACVGVLVEAFLPRPLRHLAQLAICRRRLVVAGVLTVLLMVDDKQPIAAQGAIAVDGPALFTWVHPAGADADQRAAVRRTLGRRWAVRLRRPGGRRTGQ